MDAALNVILSSSFFININIESFTYEFKTDHSYVFFMEQYEYKKVSVLHINEKF